MSLRIKICGLTRAEDIDCAVQAGADAIGFVFYPASPRYIPPEAALPLIRRLPPFVASVGLFVNAAHADVKAALSAAPLDILQFHGDESPEDCARWRRPYLKAVRMRPGVNLLEYAATFSGARALLLDTFTEKYGGSGKPFDWTLIPPDLPLPVVLSGGLAPDNVADAIRRARPAAVDVSSGVEAAKGVKAPEKIRAFILAARAAAQEIEAST
ncbi:MAG: phosphoribosylanthranilate isomerase [Zoogloeaceae bacterium]|jgi:phosphoribosylanthranilate isomerase|nr:phosphoribosylanthranilate isomerase [Zoogloeaceae bacterium]